jgi:hypothetical protein
MNTKLIIKKKLKKILIMFTVQVVVLLSLYFVVKGKNSNIPNQIKIKEIIIGANNDKYTN